MSRLTRDARFRHALRLAQIAGRMGMIPRSVTALWAMGWVDHSRGLPDPAEQRLWLGDEAARIAGDAWKARDVAVRMADRLEGRQ